MADDRRPTCPSCGSKSPGTIYAPCAMGGRGEMANPAYERFPYADPWHGIQLPDGSLTQPRKDA